MILDNVCRQREYTDLGSLFYKCSKSSVDSSFGAMENIAAECLIDDLDFSNKVQH